MGTSMIFSTLAVGRGWGGGGGGVGGITGGLHVVGFNAIPVQRCVI